MKCLHCHDERVVWDEDPRWGTVTAGPCPKCNPAGMSVQKDYRDLKKKWGIPLTEEEKAC